MMILSSESVADLLLYDINVELGLDYADPAREHFPFFQPFYGRHPDLPLRERLRHSYDSLDDGSRLLVRTGVVESLRRCAMQWLGLWRSLEIFDLHQAIAPEALSSATAARLLRLRNPADPNDRAVWLDHLIRRWREGNIAPEIEHTIWLDAIREIQYDALIPAVRYIVTAPLRGAIELVQCLDEARNRLKGRNATNLPESLELLDEVQREVIPGEMFPSKDANLNINWHQHQNALLEEMERDLEGDGWNDPRSFGLAEKAEMEFRKAA